METTIYEPTSFDEVLDTYGSIADLLRVRVLRSHDALYAGQILSMPNDDRTAGLITGGYVELVPVLGVETYK